MPRETLQEPVDAIVLRMETQETTPAPVPVPAPPDREQVERIRRFYNRATYILYGIAAAALWLIMGTVVIGLGSQLFGDAWGYGLFWLWTGLYALILLIVLRHIAGKWLDKALKGPPLP